MTPATSVPPDLVAVVVHGPAAAPLTLMLWDLGLRPLAGTTGPTVWLPAYAVDPGGSA